MVTIDLTKAINESVDQGLAKAGWPSTPASRVQVLNGMHKKLLEDEPSAHSIRPVLIAIEDEIISLTEVDER